MKRRAFLRAGGTACLLAGAGCTTTSQPDVTATAPRFDFAGVIVESLPTALEHQPFDVTVTIDEGGTRLYDERHTVDDVVHDVAFRVTEAWMHDRAPYSVTVSSPVHESTTHSTTELAANDRFGRFSGESVYFVFELFGSSIVFRPHVAERSDE